MPVCPPGRRAFFYVQNGLAFEKITLLLTDLCGLILYSRLKEVALRQTQQIIELWQI